MIEEYSFLCKLTNGFSKWACNNTNLNKEMMYVRAEQSPAPTVLLLFQLLPMILHRIQLVISPMFCQQLLVIPLLQNLAVGQNNNSIRVLDRRQSVRDNQHCAHRPHLFQGVLNQQLGLGVDIRRCFVQNHHAGLVQDRPREAEQLPLPGRKVVSAFAHLLVKAVIQLRNEFVGVYIAADLHDFLVGDALLPQHDVAADRAGEEEHILQHLAEMAAQ